jgi:uncharacterized protein YhfF
VVQPAAALTQILAEELVALILDGSKAALVAARNLLFQGPETRLYLQALETRRRSV